MKPNIFDIATKELHQDAFITWLLKYADPSCREYDPQLHACGKEFVRQLIRKQIPEFKEEIISVESDRQFYDIDVWAKVNNKYFLIIEDKTNSKEHNNQLLKYKEIGKEYVKENYLETLICIYLKTGNESYDFLNKIKDKGYSIFNREDFLGILNSYYNIDSDIFQDFTTRLTRLEKSNFAFENKPIGSWNGFEWQGFFQFLEKEDMIFRWQFVNNPNKGFWNGVGHWKPLTFYPLYLQMEQGKLCFKFCADPKEITLPADFSIPVVRDRIHKLIKSQSKKEGLMEIISPARFGSGKYMTAAIVKQENWLGGNDEIINKEKVLERLKFYQTFIDRLISEHHNF